MKKYNYVLTLILLCSCGQRESTNDSETVNSDSSQIQDSKSVDSLKIVQEIIEYVDLKETISEELKHKQEITGRQITEQNKNLILYTPDGLRLYEKGVDGDITAVLLDPEFKSQIIDKILPIARHGYHVEKAYQIAMGKIKQENTEADEWVIGNEEEFESTYNGPYLIAEFKKNMTDSAKQSFKHKLASLHSTKNIIDSEIEENAKKLLTIESKYGDKLESMIDEIKYSIRQQRVEDEREQVINQKGTYVYEDNSGKFEITVNGNQWGGQTIIKSGYGDSYDGQNAQHEFGVVKGNILYDRSGYSQIGYIRGNELYSTLGDKQVTLTKQL